MKQGLVTWGAVAAGLLACGVSQSAAEGATSAALVRGEAPAQQEDAEALVRKGMDCMAQHDDAQAVQYFARAAELGHAAAQYNLGVMCIQGRGMERHVKRGEEWLLKSARQGDAYAMEEMALLCLSEVMGEPNVGEAVRWLTAAAEKENASAQLRLGLMLVQGQGIAKDEAAGAALVRKAAQHGSAAAQHVLANLYLSGVGMEKNADEAVRLLDLAAQQGNAEALFQLGIMYLKGEGIPKDLRKAIRWLEMAASQGHPGAELLMALSFNELSNRPEPAYLRRLGMEKSPDDAVAWVEDEAAKGNANACVVQALVRLTESEDAAARKAVAEQLSKACADGEAQPVLLSEAAMVVGLMSLSGDGVEQNTDAALGLFMKAAEQGNKKAAFFLSLAEKIGFGEGLPGANRSELKLGAAVSHRLSSLFDDYMLANDARTRARMLQEIMKLDENDESAGKGSKGYNMGPAVR
ncbi:MAG: sel1 repeat family protein [Akkermansiaceae bacterium]|nr:sel1 repeat family protein [Akkermansiaceae bacterium]